MAAISMVMDREQIFLRPEELRSDPAYDVRPWSTSTEAEDTEIDNLSLRIEKAGRQLDPVLVVPRIEHGREIYVIYAGNRRRRAIALWNARISARGGSAALMKVWCVVDRSGGDIRQKAYSSNRDRKNMSAMDTAMFITKTFRVEYGADLAGTKRIADYLGISKSGVTQFERLIGPECSGELQTMMQQGVITMDAALEILNTRIKGKPLSPQLHTQVMQRAKEIENAEAAARIGSHKKQSAARKKANLEAAVAKKRVELPAIKRAIRELDPNAKVKFTVKDAKRMFKLLDSDKYGDENSSARKFARYFLNDCLTQGTGADKRVVELWAELLAGSLDESPSTT